MGSKALRFAVSVSAFAMALFCYGVSPGSASGCYICWEDCPGEGASALEAMDKCREECGTELWNYECAGQNWTSCPGLGMHQQLNCNEGPE
jgi:hypothetical protein